MPVFRTLSAFALLVSSAGVVHAQSIPPKQPAPPKLVIAISVDQFSGDLFNEYRAYYTAGLKRLSSGAVFPRGYQSHAATETCPGHATILTGVRPARAGIIANSWFDLRQSRADKGVYCAEDERQPGSTSSAYTVSPVHLRVPTLGGRMKAANPATRVVSVAVKDRAAVMMGGANTDQIWWWGGKSFVSYADRTPPPAVSAVNASVARLIAQDRAAMPLPAHCASRDIPLTLPGGRTIGTGRYARKADDATAFRVSPEGDAATLVLAAALIDEMKLGQQTQSDILSIGLSATDYIGHTYGTEGSEMCIQIAALDRELGAFFDRLDGIGIDYAVVLTADHGGHDAPERLRLNGIPDASRIGPELTPKGVDAAMSKATGLPGPLLYADGAGGDFYLPRALSAKDRAKVGKAALAMWRAHPQVAAVFTHAELLSAPNPSGPPDTWSLRDMARASFDPARSGDFVVLLGPRITPIASASGSGIATHGSPWDYDRRVPILFWRKGMAGFEQPNAVETVDIMPTLAALLALPLAPGDVDGRDLDLHRGGN